MLHVHCPYCIKQRLSRFGRNNEHDADQKVHGGYILDFGDSMIKSVSGVHLFSCLVSGLVSNFLFFAFALFDCCLG